MPSGRCAFGTSFDDSSMRVPGIVINYCLKTFHTLARRLLCLHNHPHYVSSSFTLLIVGVWCKLGVYIDTLFVNLHPSPGRITRRYKSCGVMPKPFAGSPLPSRILSIHVLASNNYSSVRNVASLLVTTCLR